MSRAQSANHIERDRFIRPLLSEVQRSCARYQPTAPECAKPFQVCDFGLFQRVKRRGADSGFRTNPIGPLNANRLAHIFCKSHVCLQLVTELKKERWDFNIGSEN